MPAISDQDRKKFLVPGVFTKNTKLEHMKEILMLESDCPEKLHSVDHLRLADLEELVRSAATRLTHPDKSDVDKAKQREDARFLKNRGMRPARVNVENMKSSRKLAGPYGEAQRALAEWRAEPDAVYFWDSQAKVRLLLEQLAEVKNSWLRSKDRVIESSSDSEDETR
jgi:predicted Zn-dependent protease